MSAIFDVNAELARQRALWGQQDHAPHEWLPILMEEVGEVAKELADSRLGTFNPVRYRTELVQVAAVALAAVEALDRQQHPTPNEWLHDSRSQSPDAR